jgi:ABC-type transport system involved in multi-copper enzyme maturation permease subunit
MSAIAKPDWRMRFTQLLAVLRIEMRRNFFTRQALVIYFLAFAPAVIIGLHALESPMGRRCNVAEDTEILAGIMQVFYMRLGIFFGCLAVFTWLFRGEIVQRSLHYSFLAPMRREILVIGKYIAGGLTTSIIFSAGALLSFIFMYGHFGPAGQHFVFDGPGLQHLFAYLTIVVLACFGYGAVFLALSLLFRNPIIPGAFFFGWEAISSVLPATMQKFSVTFYLKNLAPVHLANKGLLTLFTVVAEPVPAAIAIPGMVLFMSAILWFACWRIRTLEISYSRD